MPQHKTCVEEFQCFAEEVAFKIGSLQYDELAVFLRHLERKIAADAAEDAGRGRPVLSKSLLELAQHLGKAATKTENTWEICEKAMKKQESSP